jgi:hypothetical protein
MDRYWPFNPPGWPINHSVTVDPVGGGHPLDGPFIATCDKCGGQWHGDTRYQAIVNIGMPKNSCKPTHDSEEE